MHAMMPSLYFQLYSIHFQFLGGCNPTAVYCLLSNKTRQTYDRVLEQLKTLVPAADPETILTDFEMAAMQVFFMHTQTHPFLAVTFISAKRRAQSDGTWVEGSLRNR